MSKHKISDDLREMYEACLSRRELPLLGGDDFMLNVNARTTCNLVERIALLEAERDQLEVHRQCAIEAEKKDCKRALVALAGAGMCTPEETYGTNTSWAIADLCRAVATLRAALERRAGPVTDDGATESGAMFCEANRALKEK